VKKRALLLTVCAFLGLLFYSVISSTNGSLLSYMINHYQISEAQQGLPSSAMYIGCLCALVLNLFLIGRIPKARLLLITIVLADLLLFPLWLLPPFTVFWLLFGLMGVMTGTIDNLASSIVGELHQGKRGTRIMSILHATFGVGGIIAPLAYQAMLDGGLKWNYIYLTLLVLGFLLISYAVPVCRRGVSLETTGRRQAAEPITLKEIKRFFMSRQRVLLLLSLFFYCMYLAGNSIWGKRYIEVELGSERMGALANSLFWFGITAGRLAMSAVALPPKPFLKWGQLLSGVLLLAGILSHNAVVMCVCITVSAFVSGAVLPQVMLLSCNDYAHNTMLATTICFLGVNGGQSLSPIVAGVISSAWGNQMAMFFFAAVILLAGVFAFLVPKDEKKA